MGDRLSATDVQALITAAGEALWGSRWQSEMARALSVHRDTVYDWKTGVSTPRARVLDELRELLAGRCEKIGSVLERFGPVSQAEGQNHGQEPNDPPENP